MINVMKKPPHSPSDVLRKLVRGRLWPMPTASPKHERDHSGEHLAIGNTWLRPTGIAPVMAQTAIFREVEQIQQPAAMKAAMATAMPTRPPTCINLQAEQKRNGHVKNAYQRPRQT